MPKCELCNKDIEKTFLDKLRGTMVFIKQGDKNKEHLVCDSCQKKHKDKIKEELGKIK